MPSAPDGLADRLAGIVGPSAVVQDRRELRVYRGGPWTPSDPSGRFGRTPALAVQPADAAQTAAVLHEIVSAGRPAVPLGGATGVTGGALATEDTVVVDLARLAHPMEIDRDSRRARVGAAVKLKDLARAADTAGLLFAHDPWSQPIATVGGAISTNGVGYLAAGYGSMGQQVLGLEVALTTGEVLRLPAATTSAAGPDLARLFVGSEGTLGVVVAATVRLFPRPERREFRAFRFPGFDPGFATLQSAAEVGLPLAMIDFEEDDGETSTLYVAVDGIAAVAESVCDRLEELALRHEAQRLPDEDVRRFWSARHESANRYARQLAEHRKRLLAGDEEPETAPRRGGWRYLHLSLAPARVIEFLSQARQIAARRSVQLNNVGIWGATDLLSFWLEGEPDATEVVATELQLAAAQGGGSFEYVHGVGLRLAHLMPMALGPTMPVLDRIKQALDPSGLLNPGKQGLPFSPV